MQEQLRVSKISLKDYSFDMVHTTLQKSPRQGAMEEIWFLLGEQGTLLESSRCGLWSWPLEQDDDLSTIGTYFNESGIAGNFSA
jgi:hypothetical protein